MNKLSYKILPHPEDSTFETRFLVDEIDWLGDDYLGLDPFDLRTELFGESRNELIIGRCTCGCLGCCDLKVIQVSGPHSVEWIRSKFQPLVFDRRQYDEQINLIASDHSWEPVGRTVERLVNNIFNGRMTDDGYHFCWSSTRIQSDRVVLSFIKNQEQQHLDFAWNGITVEDATAKAKQFIFTRFGR